MNSQNKVAGDAARQRLLEKLVVALCHGALPGELDGFTDEDRREAAAFVAAACERRPKGAPVVKIETTGTRLGERGMRLCVANDNMPFLVDSVAAAISARGLVIHRLLHPVLPIRRYDTTDGAIEEVNRRARPLGLYYFGRDEAERRRVLDRTISGGVSLDDVIFHVSMEELPFGGIGPSGMGAYHGRDGFRTFSHARAVFKQAKFDVAKLAGIKPPYGPATMKAVRRQMKG